MFINACGSISEAVGRGKLEASATIAGIVASFLVPVLMNTESRLAAAVRALLAAALGYIVLLLVLEAGKLAFGKKRIRLDGPTPFTWKRHGDDAEFVLGAEQSLWSDYFAREKDRLLLKCEDAKIDNHVQLKGKRLLSRSKKTFLDHFESARRRRVVIARRGNFLINLRRG